MTYLKKPEDVKKLSAVLTAIENKNVIEAHPTLIKFYSLIDPSYSAFLDKSNPYHILLGLKIHNSLLGIGMTGNNTPDDIKLREYEKKYSISYVDELEKILRVGNFDGHIEEESFIIEELSLYLPEEIINIIENNLNRSIHKLNTKESSDPTHFRALLSTYFDHITHSDIDQIERRVLLETEIKSPTIKNTLYEFWPAPLDEESSVQE